MKKWIFPSLLLSFVCGFSYADTHATLVSASIQQAKTPDDALARLLQGNKRFTLRQQTPVNYLKKAALSAQSQHPVAIIISCIDSRVPPEIIFDQNIGNIFVTRIAANALNKDVLGGMEFGTQLSGANIILVLGHECCGAI